MHYYIGFRITRNQIARMGKQKQILLIDDDERLSAMIVEYLENNEYKVVRAATGEQGLEFHRAQIFDAVILDLMLPGIDGLGVCRELRPEGPPILMLTAKGDPMDRVLGLELGADDYLPKPFEPLELLARLKAILRRGQTSENNTTRRYGRLEVDSGAMEIRLDGDKCDLTAYQFQLLEALANASGRVLTRDQLMNAMQGTDVEAFDRSIDVHISRIRSAIEDDPKHPKRIITIRGAGYLFARSQD